MPLNNPAPNFGLLTSWDMRSLSGENAFTRGSPATTVSLPTYSAGEGVYDDVVLLECWDTFHKDYRVLEWTKEKA